MNENFLSILKAKKPGEIFTAESGREYIVLESNTRSIKKTMCLLARDIVENMRFDDNDNEFTFSNIQSYLEDDYIQQLEEDFGDMIAVYNIDLLSMDGLDTYGKCAVKAGLMTLDDYRKYRKVIGTPIDSAWWLATPHSTNDGYGSSFVVVVYSGGRVNFGDCVFECGVRPFFKLNLH